jgi:hypothetical protein
MPVDPNNYDHRGKSNWSIVLCCPRLVAPNRLVYFDYSKNSGNWVIRDLIAGQRLDNFHAPQVTRQQIEADAEHDEFPPWLDVEDNPSNWEIYLRLRTSAVFRLRRKGIVTTPHPPGSGWTLL